MSEMAPLSPETTLAVSLTIAQWRAVLEALANGPYRVVGPLIGEIERQCNAQLARMLPQAPIARRGNGESIAEP